MRGGRSTSVVEEVPAGALEFALHGGTAVALEADAVYLHLVGVVVLEDALQVLAVWM